MPKLARLGDPGSHGGAIITASPDTDHNTIPAARKTDIYGCPIHGPNPIIEGSPDIFINNLNAARVGDATACGAVITDGSPDTFGND